MPTARPRLPLELGSEIGRLCNAFLHAISCGHIKISDSYQLLQGQLDGRLPKWFDPTYQDCDAVIRKIEDPSKPLARSWGRLLLRCGIDRSKELIAGLFQNLALAAALMSGFAAAVMVAAEHANTDNAPVVAHVLSVSSVMALCSFLLSLSDCIMIDSSLRTIRSNKQFMQYLSRHQTYLGNPWRTFAVGTAFFLVELNAYLSAELDGSWKTVCAITTACAVYIGGRWRQQTVFLDFFAFEEETELADSAEASQKAINELYHDAWRQNTFAISGTWRHETIDKALGSTATHTATFTPARAPNVARSVAA